MEIKNLDILRNCTGFNWDKGNSEKNWLKHNVTPSESEQIFFNHPLVVQNDEHHSHQEIRYYALGHTDAKRLLFIAFTLLAFNLTFGDPRLKNKIACHNTCF